MAGFNQKAHIFLAGAIAFLIPSYPGALALAIGLFVLNWLCAPRLIKQGFKNVLNPVSFAMITVYLLYLLGMLYTENLKIGVETIETKFSFLILPFVFASYPDVTREKLNTYLKLFIYGCSVNALMCLGRAIYRFAKPVYVDLYGVPYDLGLDYFYYNELSDFFHPSYIAMYCIFALFGIVYLQNRKEISIGINKTGIVWLAITTLLILYTLLLSSKAGWIGLFIFAAYFFIQLAGAKKIIQGALMLLLLGIAFYFLNLRYTPKFSVRIPKMEVITQTLKGNDNENKKITTSTDGTGSRILVWKAAIDIIKENVWFGVGTGDAKDKMLETYKAKGMVSEYESKLNSHNQFLNSFIALGIPGFLSLLLCLLIPAYYSLKEKYFLYIAFVGIAGLNFLFESMLERQAGVIYFAFFYSLLYFNLQRFKTIEQP
ncbi:MAG: O-antigen ligase family protein [Bacteroidia bacterium]